MTWSDEGYILGVNIYGENSSIISILSKDHGHHKGIIYPQYFNDNSASFTDKDIYNGLLINKHQLLNYIFEPNKVKFPFYRIKLENFFNEK